MTDPKDDGLIASEADFLNTLLRQYYGDSHQVDTSDDWRTALDALVQGVHYQNAYTNRILLKQIKGVLESSNDALCKLADCWHCQQRVNFEWILSHNLEVIEKVKLAIERSEA